MEIVKTLLASKKFVATLVGVIVTTAVHLGLDAEMAQQIAPQILKLVGVYVLGQGIADHGKEAAKEHAKAADKPAETPEPHPTTDQPDEG